MMFCQPFQFVVDICFLVIFIASIFQIPVGQAQLYCDYGFYRSTVSGLRTCCAKCRTQYLYDLFKEPQCKVEPNVCQSDTGINEYRNVPDELTDSADAASIQCPSQIYVNCDNGKNFTVASVDYRENITKVNNVKDLVCTHPIGTILELGSHIVNCTATDLIHDNAITCNFTVLVVDNQNPQLECPIVNWNTILGEDYANVTYEPTVWDNSGETLQPTCSLPQGASLQIGNHSVYCVVSDSSSNTNNCSSSVSVLDNEKPTLNCQDMNVSTLPGKNLSVVTYKPAVWDNSRSPLEENCSLGSNVSLPIGRHSVSCVVRDGASNINTCSAYIFVQDNEMPGLNCEDMNFTTDPATKHANVTYEPSVWDNSGKALKATCSLAPGSLLEAGTYPVNCLVTDDSSNYNNCSASVFVKDVSSDNMTMIYGSLSGIAVFLTLLVIACVIYLLRKKQTKRIFEEDRVGYESSNGQCSIISNNVWLVVKNRGTRFLDVILATEHIQDFTKVDISWKNNSRHETIEKIDFNNVLTITDLSADRQYEFELKGYKNDGEVVYRTQYLETHKNLSETLGQCGLTDVTYDSLTVQYTGDSPTNTNMWLDVQETCCTRQDDLGRKDYHLEKKIDPNDSTVYTFEGLKPGHRYDVSVEIRTLNQVTIKDSHNIGWRKTKSVDINTPEVTSNEVLIKFSDLDADCKPVAHTCCGTQTTLDKVVSINGLEPDCDYTISYGVIYKESDLHQNTINIRTKSAQSGELCAHKCDGDIIEVLELCKTDLNKLIIEMNKSEPFLERLASALKFPDSFAFLKHEALKHGKSIFEGLLFSRSINLQMNVDEFLNLFISAVEGSEFDVCDERELLLQTDEEKVCKFYRLIEKVHANCPSCQPLFHSNIHGSSSYNRHNVNSQSQ